MFSDLLNMHERTNTTNDKKNNVNLACFIGITTLSFLNNWKWEMLCEEQRIFDESITSMCKNCLKFTTQHKTIIRFGLIVFLFKSLNVFKLSAATKNFITNSTFVNSFVAGVSII